MRFMILQTTPGHWTWTLKNDTGEILAKGQDYVRKQDCQDAVFLVKASVFASVHERPALSSQPCRTITPSHSLAHTRESERVRRLENRRMHLTRP